MASLRSAVLLFPLRPAFLRAAIAAWESVRMRIFHPGGGSSIASDQYSNVKGGWAAKIGGLLDEGWRVCYTDGTGRQGHSASAMVSEDRRGNPTLSSLSYLGEEATVADGEREAIVLALKSHRDAPMIAILSDSSSAISTAMEISRGARPPRSGIEIELGDLLAERHSNLHDTSISWVRSHIGIKGNEKADELAALASARGQLTVQEPTVTEGGIRQTSRSTRAKARTAPGFGVRRCEWNRHALSAYTWLRTDRGPQRYWLHKIGKADTSSCPCGFHTENGHHIVFECPLYHTQRKYMGNAKEWEEIDRPIWIREEEEEDEWDAVEAFFSFLYRELRGRGT